MATYQVSYDKTTRVALVQADAAAVPGGSVDVGSFEHPDETYPDSKVIYHAVRDLLYLRSFKDPAELAMYPENICDMQNVVIELETVGVVGVTMHPQNHTMGVGEIFQTEATVMPQDANDPSVTYKTSNSDIATVSETGLVTGVGAGLAHITVRTTYGTFTDDIQITIE